MRRRRRRNSSCSSAGDGGGGGMARRRRNSALSLVLLLLGQVGIALPRPRHHDEISHVCTQREVHMKRRTRGCVGESPEAKTLVNIFFSFCRHC